MPEDLYTIHPGVRDVETLRRVVNQQLRRIAQVLDQVTGYTRHRVSVNHPLDCSGQPITGVARPTGRDADVVTCGYLRDFGMLPTADSVLEPLVPVVFKNRVKVGIKATDPADVVTLGQLRGVVNHMATQMIAAALATLPPPVVTVLPIAPTFEQFAGPASSVTLATTPSAVIAVKNNATLHRTVGVPNDDQFSLTGNILTTSLLAGDKLDVYEWATAPLVETFTGPAASVTLSIIPSVVIAVNNTFTLHRTVGVPAEGQFRLAGPILTTPLSAGDVLDVYEWL